VYVSVSSIEGDVMKAEIMGYVYAQSKLSVSRAIALAVSRRIPTAAARVRAQVKSCGISGGQSDIGAGILRVLPIPLPILIPPTVPHASSSIIRGLHNRPVSGRRTEWTVSPHPKKLKKKKLLSVAPARTAKIQ
jgi:hypothetical protein